MSVTTKQFSKKFEFTFLMIAIIGGGSIIVNPNTILEFSNDEPFIEDIPYEEITSLEPFELVPESKKISDKVKDARNKILTEEFVRSSITELPEDAGAPSNSNSLGNTGSNSPSNSNSLGNTGSAPSNTPNSGSSNINPETKIIPQNPIIQPDANPMSWTDSAIATISSDSTDETIVVDGFYRFPDVDGDGIDDRWDQCLDWQENWNGYADWDGCPENIPNGPLNTHRDMQ